MTSMAEFAKRAEKFTIDNSPLILTAVGTAGVIATAVLTGKAAFKAAELLGPEDDRIDMTKMEMFAFTWKNYVPACGVGLLTVGAVVGANQIGTRRAAALAAAFTISERAFDEYKGKVKETFGAGKEEKVVNAVAKDRMMDNPPTVDNTIIITNDGDQLFQDSWSARYFRTSAESVHQAVNQLNHTIITEGQATLTDFYELLGLAKTRESDEIGWNANKLLDVYFAPVLHDNGQMPALAIEYRVVPSRNYFRTH